MSSGKRLICGAVVAALLFSSYQGERLALYVFMWLIGTMMLIIAVE